MDRENKDVSRDDSILNMFGLREIEDNFKDIESTLEDYYKQDNKDNFLKILFHLQTIRDLAMVYGYEGIETLAYHLHNTISLHVKKKNALPSRFISKFDMVINAMNAAFVIDNEDKINEVIDEIVYKFQSDEIKNIQDIDHKTLTLESALSDQDGSHSSDLPLFDIREAHSIKKLITKIENHNSLSEGKEIDEENEVNLVDENQNQQITDDSNDTTSFNQVFCEEFTESLDDLDEYIELAIQGVSLGEALMHIKEACGSLNDAAIFFKASEIQLTTNLLNKFAKHKLIFNQSPDLDDLEVLNETSRVIREFVQNGKADFDRINLVLNNLIVQDSELEIDGEDE